MNPLLERITLNPKVCNGKPTLRNMRFIVAQMLKLLSAGMAHEEILEDYPFIEVENSKWNKIEHKMFCFLTMNWRGVPLVSQQTVVQLISGTATKSGLTIRAELDENVYQKGLVVSDEEHAKVNLMAEEFHGEWNYRVEPIGK